MEVAIVLITMIICTTIHNVKKFEYEERQGRIYEIRCKDCQKRHDLGDKPTARIHYDGKH
jgi:ribosomal protein S27E